MKVICIINLAVLMNFFNAFSDIDEVATSIDDVTSQRAGWTIEEFKWTIDFIIVTKRSPYVVGTLLTFLLATWHNVDVDIF
ncbi:MAG: hypothetical protein GXY06_05465 [Clostridiaceae bacterium]|nr:hypothetical protein [Clostridiaceae bacterium]